MNKAVSPDTICSLNAGRFEADAAKSFTLPASWYTDPAVYRLEHEAIFYGNWIYQCHVSDVPNPGDYYVGRVADQSIFIMRANDGQLHAYYNVCSHRAHPLLNGQGTAKLIVCPYHQWCYQADGKFRGARGRKSLEEWIPENADLKPVGLENYGGFLFVNLDLEARPLIDQASKLLADMKRCCPRMDEFVRVERYELEVAANWKTVIDNNHECYHCSVNHPTLMELVDYDNKAVWSDHGITFSHEVESKNLDNGAYALKAEEVEQQALFGYIWPTVIPLMYPGSPNLAMFQIIPISVEKTLERWDFYLAHTEANDQERRYIEYIKSTLIKEDVGLCEEVQKGLHSRGYTQGRFVVDRTHNEFSEHHVHFFQNFVKEALSG
jgi:carnitine monooxygenase subunit